MNDLQDENPNYYAVIPAEVRYDKNLRDKAKLLYGEISSLCNKYGYCWASNSYFAKLYNVSITTISTLINELLMGGYIYREIIKKPGSKEIEGRKIYITPIKENLNTYLKNFKYPIKENLKKNNKNIIINNNKVSKKESFDDIINLYTQNEELRTELKNHLATRKAKKATLTNRAIELSLKTLDKLAETDDDKLEIVRQSIERGWTGFFEIKKSFQQRNDEEMEKFLNDIK